MGVLVIKLPTYTVRIDTRGCWWCTDGYFCSACHERANEERRRYENGRGTAAGHAETNEVGRVRPPATLGASSGLAGS
jgi:hypothetical protein